MNTSVENIVYKEITKKKDFDQLTLTVVCSACCCHGSGEVSECDVTWRTVKVEHS